MATRKSRTLKIRKSKKTRNNRKYSRKQYGSGVTTTALKFYLNPNGSSPPKLIGSAPNGITITPARGGVTIGFKNLTPITNVKVSGVNAKGGNADATSAVHLKLKTSATGPLVLGPRLIPSTGWGFTKPVNLMIIDIGGLATASFGTLKNDSVNGNVIVTLTMATPTNSVATTTLSTSRASTSGASTSGTSTSGASTTTISTSTMPTTTISTSTMPTTTISTSTMPTSTVTA